MSRNTYEKPAVCACRTSIRFSRSQNGSSRLCDISKRDAESDMFGWTSPMLEVLFKHSNGGYSNTGQSTGSCPVTVGHVYHCVAYTDIPQCHVETMVKPSTVRHLVMLPKARENTCRRATWPCLALCGLLFNSILPASSGFSPSQALSDGLVGPLQ